MKKIIITGASGGIGEACCKKILKQGDFVIGISRQIGKKSEELSDEQFVGIDFDLNNVECIPGLIKDIVDKYGPIDGYIHCAGFDKMVPLGMVKPSDMEELWRIHAQVPMVMTSVLSKKKMHNENASIVLISSQSAHEGAMGHAFYASAKGAIEGFLAPASAELMEKNMRLNIVCFSPVETKMYLDWAEKLTPESKQKLMASYPLGIMTAEEAATYICYLISEDAKYINGQIITVDAGHSTRKV